MRNLKDRQHAGRDPLPQAKAEPYRQSELVLTWLVLFDISKMNVELPASFPDVLGIAFDRASQAVRDGKLLLDYAPQSPQVFDMPEPGSKMYMQAILYWGTRFDCRPAVLADAYARLGRAAPAANGYMVVSNLKDDELGRRDNSGDPIPRALDQPSTLPIFVATVPA